MIFCISAVSVPLRGGPDLVSIRGAAAFRVSRTRRQPFQPRPPCRRHRLSPPRPRPNRLTTSGDSYDDNGNMTLEADLKQGLALYRAGDLRGAIERLTAAIDVAPRSIEAHQLLGNAFKHSGRLREAI